MLDNLTILSCSYNTPLVTLNMLRSIVVNHPDTTFKLLISENSTNKDTVNMLEMNRVPFIRNPGATHSVGMNKLFEMCETEYALLLDTDIIIKQSLMGTLSYLIENKADLAGEFQGDRGGKLLHTRITPWFCFVNIKRAKEFNIKFNDVELMTSNNLTKPRKCDVGSTMFHDFCIARGNLYNMYSADNPFYTHYEGMSWRIGKYGDNESDIDIGGTHCNKQLYEWGKKVEELYTKNTKHLADINIKGKFIYE